MVCGLFGVVLAELDLLTRTQACRHTYTHTQTYTHAVDLVLCTPQPLPRFSTWWGHGTTCLVTCGMAASSPLPIWALAPSPKDTCAAAHVCTWGDACLRGRRGPSRAWMLCSRLRSVWCQSNRHTDTHTHTHAQTHRHTHRHTHTHTHRHTDTHTHQSLLATAARVVSQERRINDGRIHAIRVSLQSNALIVTVDGIARQRTGSSAYTGLNIDQGPVVGIGFDGELSDLVYNGVAIFDQAARSARTVSQRFVCAHKRAGVHHTHCVNATKKSSV